MNRIKIKENVRRKRNMKELIIISIVILMLSCESQQKMKKTTDDNEGTLVLSILSVESSYIQNIERATTKIPDTVQWWICETTLWRIKTFGIDHDIHVYNIEKVPERAIEFCQKNTEKNYGDVIASTHVLTFRNKADPKSVAEVFRKSNLGTNFEISESGFLFWKPDEEKYKSKSKPKEQ